MSHKFFVFIFILLSFLLTAEAHAENIDTDNAGNDFAVLEFDDSQISFDCTSCNVSVSDSEITGYAWGESIGWINLQPGSSGVVNDGDGNLSGYAWGENTGWVNFDPTFGGVTISSGEFDGYAWSENYGWIQFDCGVSGACVSTSWAPSGEDPSPGGGGGGGGNNDGCTNQSALNFDPEAEDDDGSCIFPGDVIGCTVSSAINYDPAATIDNNTCQFGEIEIPDSPDDEDTTDNPFDIIDTIFDNPFDSNDSNSSNNGGGSDSSSSSGQSSSDGVGDENGKDLFTPVYTFSKVDVEKASKVIPIILLGLTLLSIPFQQLLQIPSRAVQLVFSWFGINKKKTWGVVFDSITKQALDPVVVALKDTQGKIIQTSITDMEGRFGFIAPPGLYNLEAHKADYVFPSQKLAGKTGDGLYDDLYFGGTFQVLEQGEIITKNIPLDAVNFNWNEYEKARLGIGHKKTFWEKIQKYSTGIFVFGFILSIVAVFVVPILWNYVVLGLYILMGILQMLGLPKHSGNVTRNGQPLSFGVMRVFSNSLKKEMKKVVLDKMGNYYCLIRNGEYYVTFEQRNEDGTYTPVYTSEPIKSRNGSIRKKFNI